MKKCCTVLDDYQDVSRDYADWSTLSEHLSLQVITQHIDSQSRLVERLKDSEIIVIMRERTPFDATLLAKLPKLKLLITSGPRNGAIDVAAASTQGVLVCGTQAFKQPPTELTWALILGLSRHIVIENNHFRQGGPWQSNVGLCLSGKTIGLIGLGAIGERVALIAKAFGMHVLAWSENLTQQRATQLGVEYASSKKALLQQSDIVSLHLIPGTRNKGIMGTLEFNQMKPSALFINTARAALVDQDAMYDALTSGKIAAAGIDVFDIEPLPSTHRLRSLDNLLATPHLGYVADLNYQVYFKGAVDNIHAYIAGKELAYPLNLN
ncbi:MAG: D-2-hydroxyacid dehydrogenase family protein [Oceanospirillaceae bacterium]|nr:D-2-hydroxyacid dehydrogenase family protein [Oceanospirillaceae bacterium]